MPINWKAPETYQRLLAAMHAASPQKAQNYARIAALFGDGATYDAIEGRFRIIKRDAARLEAEMDGRVKREDGASPAPSATKGKGDARGKGKTAGRPRAKATAGTGSTQRVLGGRVTKARPAKSATEEKAKAKAPEVVVLDDSSAADDDDEDVGAVAKAEPSSPSTLPATAPAISASSPTSDAVLFADGEVVMTDARSEASDERVCPGAAGELLSGRDEGEAERAGPGPADVHEAGKAEDGDGDGDVDVTGDFYDA